MIRFFKVGLNKPRISILSKMCPPYFDFQLTTFMLWFRLSVRREHTQKNRETVESLLASINGGLNNEAQDFIFFLVLELDKKEAISGFTVHKSRRNNPLAD